MNDTYIVAVLIGILGGLLCGGTIVIVGELTNRLAWRVLATAVVYAFVWWCASELIPGYTDVISNTLIIVSLLTVVIGGYVIGLLNRKND